MCYDLLRFSLCFEICAVLWCLQNGTLQAWSILPPLETITKILVNRHHSPSCQCQCAASEAQNGPLQYVCMSCCALGRCCCLQPPSFSSMRSISGLPTHPQPTINQIPFLCAMCVCHVCVPCVCVCAMCSLLSCACGRKYKGI